MLRRSAVAELDPETASPRPLFFSASATAQLLRRADEVLTAELSPRPR